MEILLEEKKNETKDTGSRKRANFSFFNYLTVAWLTALLCKGAKDTLKDEDLYDLPEKFKSEALSTNLDDFWITLKQHHLDPIRVKAPSLFKIVFGKYWISVFAAVFFMALSVACTLTIPTFLQQIIFFLTKPVEVRGIVVYDPKKTEVFLDSGPVLCLILVALQIFSTLFLQTSTQIAAALQVQFKSLLIGAVFGKGLRLTQKSSRDFSPGLILNIVNVDVEKISLCFMIFSQLMTAPIQVAVSLYLLSRLIGVAVWGGFGIIFGILATQISVIGLLAGYQKSFLEGGDKRLKLIREMLYGIKIVKFRALESFFTEKIVAIRNVQLSFLTKYYSVQALFVGLIQISPIAMPLTSFLIYGALNGDVRPDIIFPALSLFQGLFQPILTIPQSLTAMIVAVVSWNRISSLLLAEESELVKDSSFGDKSSGNVAIAAQDCSFRWETVTKQVPEKVSEKLAASSKKVNADSDSKQVQDESEAATSPAATQFQVEHINISVPKGLKVGLVGSVGSGKSSLLSGLIGEMPKISGEFQLFGSLAYCNQSPWILTDSIMGNIVFNQELDEQKLAHVLRVCGLDKDLENLASGVQTEIGEKGINLSGGQKSRLSLARALYYNPDILLLDDPLSSLDAQVGRTVFDLAIKDYLKEKTVVLVTHQLHFLPELDYIIVVANGKVVQQGSYKLLMEDKNGVLFTMMADYKVDDKDENPAVKQIVVEEQKAEVVKVGLIVEEDKQKGAVDLKVFWGYLQKCGGAPFVVLVVFAACLSSGTQVLTNLWLSWWSTNQFNLGLRNYMMGYGLLGLTQFIFALIINTVFLSGCYRAAQYYHPIALHNLLRAPMGFFDSQPIGRILNRLSKDIEAVDQNIWILLFLTTVAVAGALSALAFLCYVDQRMIALAIPLCILYFYVLKYYQRSNIEFKRFESTKRSPLYAHVSETLSGISTVKAYGVEKDFIAKQKRLMDESNVPTFLRLLASVWVSLRIGVASSSLTLLLSLLGVSGTLDSSLIGLSLTYAIAFAASLGLLLFASSQLENEFNSVERLQVYCEELPEEAEVTLEGDPSPAQWPSKGEVIFKNISLSYPSAPEKLILKNINFKVLAGEKVGVIGRTGSGKSTLMTALFRLVEPSTGSIEIDGRDTSKMGLSTLRRAIQIIPQDPILFSGTIRENVDVETKFNDEQVYEVLSRIGLKDYVESLSEKLLSPVLENGQNLSIGQRQLLCLGRSILLNPRILIMDEATASVDGEADKRIQQSIKTYFKDTTVISIAHRLNSIADFDRVLVLSDGELIEYDSPHVLLSNPKSLFSDLANATGVGNESLLRTIALEKHNSINK